MAGLRHWQLVLLLQAIHYIYVQSWVLPNIPDLNLFMQHGAKDPLEIISKRQTESSQECIDAFGSEMCSLFAVHGACDTLQDLSVRQALNLYCCDSCQNIGPSVCIDVFPECSEWAASGECHGNPNMLITCCQSCSDVNPCEPNPCPTGEACVRLPNNGYQCETGGDPCETNPCNNGGTCIALNNVDSVCGCSQDYTGDICNDMCIDSVDKVHWPILAWNYTVTCLDAALTGLCEHPYFREEAMENCCASCRSRSPYGCYDTVPECNQADETFCHGYIDGTTVEQLCCASCMPYQSEPPQEEGCTNQDGGAFCNTFAVHGGCDNPNQMISFSKNIECCEACSTISPHDCIDAIDQCVVLTDQGYCENDPSVSTSCCQSCSEQDQCLTQTCSSGYYCVRLDAYDSTCLPDPNPCESQPCQNGGTCVPIIDGTYICHCSDQWMGDTCDLVCEDITDPYTCATYAASGICDAIVNEVDLYCCRSCRDIEAGSCVDNPECQELANTNVLNTVTCAINVIYFYCCQTCNRILFGYNSGDEAIECMSNTIRARISFDWLTERLGLDDIDASSFHLVDENCLGNLVQTSNGTYVEFEFGLYECQTSAVQSSDGNVITFSNAVFTSRGTNVLQMRCHYDTNLVMKPIHIVTNPCVVSFEVENWGKFEYEATLYTDDTFSDIFNEDNFPIRICDGNLIYFGLKVDANDSVLEMLVEECYASHSDDPNDVTGVRYSLITHGCLEPTMIEHTIEPSDDLEKHYSWDAYAVVNTGDTPTNQTIDIYVHCRSLICKKDEPETRCQDGCISTTRRELEDEIGIREIVSDSGTSDSVMITHGPFRQSSRCDGD